jgi:O-antigen/teichoic acid export membrane protein
MLKFALDKHPTSAIPAAAPSPVATEDNDARGRDASKKHLRGSSLLLVGRGLAVLINFAAQVLMVRSLAVSEFGAFAFGLATVLLLSKIAELGLGKGLSRNMSIYHEQQDYGQLFGALSLGLGTVTGVGLLLAMGVVALQDLIAARLVVNPLSMNILLILSLLIPLQALEDVLEKTFAVFCRARALFFRRHLLGPLLKLSAVLVLLAFHGNVYALALGYLAASLIGTAISLVLLWQILNQQDLLSKFQWRTVRIPAREVFGFSIPLISTDLAFLFRASLIVFLLEFFLGSIAVAAFRAVSPVARLNMLVFDSFKTLFLPLASRLFAKRDHSGIADLYWSNASWLAVLTFPVFIATFSLAGPTTTLLFGERYAHSAPILAILSLGCFVNVVFGFNSLMLRVYGKVRPIVIVDLATALVALVLGIVLVPRYGPIGGAVATSSSLILQNILQQAMLARLGEFRLIDARFLRILFTITVATVALLLIQSAWQPSLLLVVLLIAAASIAVLAINIRHLDIESTFPELRRLPAARFILGEGSSG